MGRLREERFEDVWLMGLLRGAGQSWHAAFAFSLVGILCLFWIMVMAYQVFVASL